MSENKSKMSILTNGILNENPVLRLVLGTCPTLAVTTMASNGIGMGLAATFVLLCSNIVISALRKIIPDQVRIPCYITVIAGFVSIVQMVVKAYVPDLDKALGVYLPLITTNCAVLGVALLNIQENYNFIESVVYGITGGIGFDLGRFCLDLRCTGYPGARAWRSVAANRTSPPCTVRVRRDLSYGCSLAFLF